MSVKTEKYDNLVKLEFSVNDFYLISYYFKLFHIHYKIILKLGTSTI